MRERRSAGIVQPSRRRASNRPSIRPATVERQLQNACTRPAAGSKPSSGKALSGINHRLSKLGSSICQRRIGKRVSAGLFDETFPGERLQRRRKTLAVGFQAGMHGQALYANCATLLAKPFKYCKHLAFVRSEIRHQVHDCDSLLNTLVRVGHRRAWIA
jgi:hypothetical protein